MLRHVGDVLFGEKPVGAATTTTFENPPGPRPQRRIDLSSGTVIPRNLAKIGNALRGLANKAIACKMLKNTGESSFAARVFMTQPA